MELASLSKWARSRKTKLVAFNNDWLSLNFKIENNFPSHKGDLLHNNCFDSLLCCLLISATLRSFVKNIICDETLSESRREIAADAQCSLRSINHWWWLMIATKEQFAVASSAIFLLTSHKFSRAEKKRDGEIPISHKKIWQRMRVWWCNLGEVLLFVNFMSMDLRWHWIIATVFCGYLWMFVDRCRCSWHTIFMELFKKINVSIFDSVKQKLESSNFSSHRAHFKIP